MALFILAFFGCAENIGPGFSAGGDGSGLGIYAGDVSSGGDNTGGGTDNGFVEPEDCGTSIGETICEIQGTTTGSGVWSIYDERGAPLIFMIGHGWDGTLVSTGIEIADAARSTNATAVVMLMDGTQLEVADTDDALIIATQTGVDDVVLDSTGEGRDDFNPLSTSKTFLIDEDSVIISVSFGFVSSETLQGSIDQM